MRYKGTKNTGQHLVIALACLGLSLLVAHQTAWANAWITIEKGSFLMGSTAQEVETGYQISAQGYGHDGVRNAGWFDHEIKQHPVSLPTFSIQKTPVTNAEYAAFIADTGHAAPYVSPKVWQSYGLVHPYVRAKQYMWHDGQPPQGKAKHPVVLVSWADAQAYAAWLSQKLHRHIHLPSEAQWEKAIRGQHGNLYPWGNRYDPNKLNNADAGSFSTMPVGSFAAGASPYGVLDGAGQVFEWTATDASAGRKIVKGGSWDDRGGVCRSAARHGRPVALKHILIGFRLVAD